MRLIALASLVALVSCSASSRDAANPGATSSVHFGGGNGADCATAVVIQGAQNEQEGVAAEYSWVSQHYPDAQPQGQALIDCNGHEADRLTLATSNGETREVFFDIHEYFGKF